MEENGPSLSTQGTSLHTAPISSEALIPTGSLENVQSQGALADTATTQEVIVVPPRRNHWFMWATVGLIACLLFGGGIFITKGRSGQRSQLEAGHFGTISLPLQGLQAPTASAYTAKSLEINGELQIAGSIQLSAGSKPVNPQAGQLYYDKTTHQLGYYDGTGFVYMQGGASTSITNNYTTGPTINNITNVSGGGVSASGGTAGHLAMFTAANTLGDSLISQSGNDINILTTDQTGASGNIVIQSGASSTTAGGDVTIDTGASIITGLLINTKTFESGLENMGVGFGYNDTIASSTTEAHSGTHSLAVTVGLGPVFLPEWKVEDGSPDLTMPITAGHKYAFSAWVRAGGTSSNITAYAIWSSNGFEDLTQQVAWGTVTDVSTGWKQVSGILTAPAGDKYVLMDFESNIGGAVGDIHYIDDVSMTDISSSASVADINLGTANAQRVTIGNVNQIGATSIYGSGITLAGGLGNTSISGGAVTISGAGNSSISSAGNLNIQASTTSSWGIGPSGSTGGSLTLHAGTAGGNNNGGSLTLVSGDGSQGGIGGNVTLDTGAGAVSGVVVDTRNFESGTQSMQSWFGTTVSLSNTVSRSGTSSLAETADGGWWGVQQDQNSAGIPIVAGHTYFFSAYVRAMNTPTTIGSFIQFTDSTGTGTGSLTLNSATTVSNGVWTEITGTGTAPATTTKAFWTFTGTTAAGDIQFFDDLTTTDLSASTSTSKLNLGTANAQVVNIGNMGEIGATTIQGGSGITVDSGASNLSISGGLVTLTGKTVIKPGTDSSSAFEVQNAAGSSLLIANTSSMTITIASLIVSANITVNGHIVTGGAVPVIAAGAAACTAPTVNVNGTDTSGTITITTGTGCAGNGILATVTFAAAFGAAPHIILTPGGANALTLGAYIDDSTVSTTSFNLGTNSTPAASTTYRWNYLATQ